MNAYVRGNGGMMAQQLHVDAGPLICASNWRLHPTPNLIISVFSCTHVHGGANNMNIDAPQSRTKTSWYSLMLRFPHSSRCVSYAYIYSAHEKYSLATDGFSMKFCGQTVYLKPMSVMLFTLAWLAWSSFPFIVPPGLRMAHCVGKVLMHTPRYREILIVPWIAQATAERCCPWLQPTFAPLTSTACECITSIVSLHSFPP
jgi:hypothetical protein